MAFPLTRPPSREGLISQGHDDDPLTSALHAALSSIVPGSSAHPDNNHDMIKEKERAGIEIVVESNCLFLKGTGVDVEPALLKGHIALLLREPTSIKEITLQFRGKAKLPLASTDLSLSTSPQWYTICNHEWSFLEGEKQRKGRTLKAGFHKFPFQLQLGGCLPSSISTDVFGGTHVSYKLRAVVVRPGLSANMQTIMPISIVRTFAPQSLEYQQSLEIENTWPEKVMYSIMLPHKAWAAGDELTTIVKFSPLSKGVRVLSVMTTIFETTKLHCRGGIQEHTRSVVSVNQDIPNGNSERPAPIQGQPPLLPSLPTVPSLSSERSLVALASQQGPNITPSHESHSTPASPLSDPSSLEIETVERTPISVEVPMSRDDVFARLTLFIPKSVTPSHCLEPITVSHRIRWTILMSNLDGHSSELRCSLPLHILDTCLLDEARANSAATRRLLLGGVEEPVDARQEVDLPSYSAHVRDRVANMYLPDAATTRVPNPWVHSNVSPTSTSEHQFLSGTCSPPCAASPLMPLSVSSHLPHVPQSGTNTCLDWVNSELLLSISNTGVPRPQTNTSPNLHSPDSASRPDSGPVSGRGSRVPSPDRPHTTSLSVAHTSTCLETFVHDGHASRKLPGLFSIQMKPYTSLTSSSWLPSRSNSHSSLADAGYANRASNHVPRQPTLPVSMPGPVPAPVSSQAPTVESVPESTLWRRALTVVPNYGVASRGFIGGVTPLTSMRGLPSYEEAERSVSGSNVGDGDDGRRLTIRRTGSRWGRVA